MKKIISLIIASVTICYSLFCLSSCHESTKEYKEYTGKKIDCIEYVVYGEGMFPERSKHDFTTGYVYRGVNLRDGFAGEEYTLDTALNDDIINAFYNAGLLEPEEKYSDEKTVTWRFNIGYSDGTQKTYTNLNAKFNTSLYDAAIAYYDITGKKLFGIDIGNYIFEKFPHIYADFDEVHSSSGISGYMSTQAYTWKHEKVGNLDEITAEVADSDIKLEGVEYRVKVSANKLYNDLYRYKYNSVSVVSYDQSLGDKQNVEFTESMRQIKFTAVPNRIYVITMEFDDGVLQYHFNNIKYTD